VDECKPLARGLTAMAAGNDSAAAAAVAGILSNLQSEHADNSLAHSTNLPHGRALRPALPLPFPALPRPPPLQSVPVHTARSETFLSPTHPEMKCVNVRSDSWRPEKCTSGEKWTSGSPDPLAMLLSTHYLLIFVAYPHTVRLRYHEERCMALNPKP
jgi:hypothetical protein